MELINIKEFIKENGSDVEQLLDDYSNWLYKQEYLDSDYYTEQPTAVLNYLEEKQK